MKNYHKNPRQIKDKQFRDLRAWLLELGDLSGIVHDLNTDEVISGNQRMRAIDIAKCEIVLMDGPHEPDAQGTVAHGYVIWQGAKYNYRQVRWTAEQCEKANIVANKAGGTWDFDILANEWEKDDLLEWGFELEELGMLPDDDAPEDPGAQIDKAEELREKWGVKSGDLWQLGEHRLICGDCTDAAVVARVMDGEKAHLLMTSPPYWVGKDYEQEQSWEEVQAFIVRAVTAFVPVVSHRMVINTGAPQAARLTGERAHIRLLIDDWQRELHGRGFLMRYIRIWSKRGGLAHTAPRSDCIDQHWEFIATFYRPETYEGQRRLGEKWATDGLWDDVQGEMSSHGHVAAFPLEIPERNIRLYTDSASLVFEPFNGSGTTLIACERLGRKCRAVEVSPAYCAVAIERWVDMTGLTPELTGV